MFDWTKVEGYREDMTSDEKLALLENFDPSSLAEPAPVTPSAPTVIPKGYVSKAQFDKVSSDLSTIKKQLREKMSTDEQLESDRLAEQEQMKQELETLKREKTLSSYKASYLAQGYDEALAGEAAEAMADGDTDTVFKIMRKHTANAEKAMRAKILKETPVPPAGMTMNDDEKAKKEAAKLREWFGLPPV